MNRVKEAVVYLGGTCRVADLMGVSRPTVSKWIFNNEIPEKRMAAFKKLVGRRFKSSELNGSY